MMTKACTNSKCPAYAHFVYTVAMRCVLCRCDLRGAQRNIEDVGSGRATGADVESPRKAGRAHAAR
jgi:hypothetical protein